MPDIQILLLSATSTAAWFESVVALLEIVPPVKVTEALPYIAPPCAAWQPVIVPPFTNKEPAALTYIAPPLLLEAFEFCKVAFVLRVRALGAAVVPATFIMPPSAAATTPPLAVPPPSIVKLDIVTVALLSVNMLALVNVVPRVIMA